MIYLINQNLLLTFLFIIQYLFIKELLNLKLAFRYFIVKNGFKILFNYFNFNTLDFNYFNYL
jgi:hypothetical protein